MANAGTGPSAATKYPATDRGSVVDDYHGTRVPDPYRWMESLDSPQVKSWVEAQNRIAEPYLTSIPEWSRLKTRLTQLWDYEQYGYYRLEGKDQVPRRAGDRWFFTMKSGKQNQAVLYWMDSPQGTPRVLLDPNTLSSDATISLANFEVSADGRYVAWAISDGGTDWKTWRIREVATGKDLPEELQQIKFTNVAWAADSKSLYYGRYPLGANGKADDQKQPQVFLHVLGTPQSEDRLVFEITDHPRRVPSPEISRDGRWLLYNIFEGYEANGYYLKDLKVPDAPVRRFLDKFDGVYSFLGNEGDTLFFKTTQGAPRGRVVAIDANKPEPKHWQVVVAERPERLDFASLVGGHVVAHYLKDARSVVRVHRLDGSLRNELKLPGLGTVSGFPDDLDNPVTFFSYTDYMTPPALYRYDVRSDKVELFRRPSIVFDSSRYVTEQVFVPSKDGTRIPLFITKRKDAKLDGNNPTLLYGYGGFDVSLTPGYSPLIAAWLEMGGIYVEANLRGGGEYGEEWHAAGTKLRKQNVFDDFIAAAEWLIENRYTKPARLAIYGGSNGGLLVGAVMTQRPELFGAALPTVGVLDMLRYHTTSANAYLWSSDYGTSETPEMFKGLHAYSPVHNVKPGTCYPPTLVTTADRDDRVVPWHSYKFTAELQRAQGCENPILLRVETRAGHGAGKPTWMKIEDVANRLAFLARHLGM
jgi:prolyl oligopeptidase